MELEQATVLVKGLQVGFKGEMSSETAETYIELLGDLPYEPTAAEIRELLCTVEFRPSIAEIRHGVAERCGFLPNLDDDEMVRQAQDHWHYVDQMQWAGESYRPVKPETHPLVVRACDAVDPDSYTWVKELREVYKALVEAETKRILGSDFREIFPELDSGS